MSVTTLALAAALYATYCGVVWTYGLIWAARHRDRLRKGSLLARLFPAA